MANSVIIAVDRESQVKWCEGILIQKGYRVFKSQKIADIASILYQYNIDAILSNPNIKNIPLYELIPLLKKFYNDTKVVVFLERYNAEEELTLRLNGVSHIIPWPISEELFVSVFERIFKKDLLLVK